LKAPAFDYIRARSLDEAISLLAEHGDEAKIIAGGQSLVPALNLRLLAPALLVDIGGLAELRHVTVGGGTVRIGALTRYVDLERSPDIATHAPLLRAAVAHIAHPAIRNRGTVGGNLANADPASEFPACALALQARMTVSGPKGERTIAAADFFKGVYETALRPDEILTRLEFPAVGAGERVSFRELARRSGDFALVGLAAQAHMDGDSLRDLRLAYFGVGSRATLAARAAGHLVGQAPSEGAIAKAVAALADDLAPHDDLHASAKTRLHLAGVLLRRAVPDLLAGSPALEQERKRA
jgi:carbon-monoxide dehydrogenase medium subunit